MGEAMLIEGARVAISPTNAVAMNLWLHNGLVSFFPVSANHDTTLNLKNYLVLPGLINAHEHLELNLFPRLGRGPYPNATAWAKDIYHPQEPPVREHIHIPKSMRLRWGALKNLISGVTTVAHHNAIHPEMFNGTFPVRVVRRFGWAHSIAFSPDWKIRMQQTPADCPFIIHAAEGTDEAANRELYVLAEAGALRRPTLFVHAVAVRPADLPTLSASSASVVWCPSSNQFTLGRSLDTSLLDSGIPIALGTDSAMTASGDMLDELRVAHSVMSTRRLYRMVTSEPARMLNLPAGFGKICQGGPADLIVMPDTDLTPADALLQHCPELVIVGGRIRLLSFNFAHHCPQNLVKSLQRLHVEGRGWYWVAEDMASLLREAKRTLKEDIRLAGKAVAA